MGGISIKTKRILIFAILLTAIISLGCVTAADADAISDTDVLSDTVTADVDTTANTVDTTDTSTVVETADTEPADLSDTLEESDPITTEPSDSADLQEQSDVIADNSVNPKNELKANALGADDVGTLTELYNAVRNGGTVTLNKSYAYNAATDSALVNGMTIGEDLTINGNGHTIDGANTARLFILNGYRNGLFDRNWHGHTYVLNNINFINAYASGTTNGGAITSVDYPNTITISNCNFTNNRGYRGPAVYVSVHDKGTLESEDTGRITITGCVFKENYASNNGGAIYSGISNRYSSITAYNNVFINNTAPNAGKTIYYVPNYAPNVDYNWWGQNTWNNNFVANSATTFVTPDYRYQASIDQTSGKTVELTLALNGGTAPSGSTLPLRNATFAIASGIIDPEGGMFRGSIEATYASLENTTITAVVDNQRLTLNVSNTPRETIDVLTITVANVVLPNNAQVVVNTDVRGTFNITIGNTVKEVNITNGQVTIPWDDLPEGVYFAIVSCIGDIRYEDKFAYTQFKVEKQNVTITVTATPDTVTYGDSITLSSTLNNTAATAGTTTYYIDGTATTTTLNNLPVGEYTVIAKYTGDPNFNDAESAPVTIKVNKATPIITITSTQVTYPADAIVDFELKNSNNIALPGVTLRVTINGVTYAVETGEDGKASLTVKGLAANEDGYDIVAVSVANENYASATYSGDTKVVVKKADITVTANDVLIDYPNKGTIVITTDVAGTYTVKVGDKTYTDVALVAGENHFAVTDVFNVGEYDISVTAPATANYNAVDTGKLATYKVSGSTIHVSAPNVAVTYPEKGVIVITTDVAGTYTVKVGDKTYADLELIAGDNNLAVDEVFDAGTYDVKVSANIANYEAITDLTIATYTVNNGAITVTGQGVLVTYPNKGTIKITTDVAGTYTVKVGDKTYENVELAAGETHFAVADVFDAGTYDVKVSANIANYEELADVPIATYTVEKATLVIGVNANPNPVVYGNTVALTNDIIAPEGAVIAGTVTFYIDGVATDATVPVDKLTVGTHTVVAKYTGDSNFNDAESAAKTITVTKATPTIDIDCEAVTYPEAADVYITLTGVDNAALPGATVRVTINGVTYAVVTGEDGKAKLTVKDLPANEEGYAITAESVADDTYNAATYTGTTKVVVKKADITVTATDVSIDYPGKGGFVITTDVAGTYTVKVGDKTYTDVALIAGENHFAVTDVFDVGEYDISVTAPASANYNAVDTGKIATYTVEKGTITVSAPNVEVTYPENGVIVITTDVAGTYTVKVGDKTYENLDLIAGDNNLAVDEVFDVGTYDVIVSADIANYEAITDLTIATYTVNNGAITVTGQGVLVTYPNKGAIVITTDVAGTYTVKVGDKTYTDVALIAGENHFAVADVFGAGSYDVKVSANIDNYEELSDVSIATYTVAKAQSTIGVSYEDGVFTITLDGVNGEKLNETVSVAFDGTPIDLAAKTENGVYSFTEGSLSPGRHSIAVTFEGNQNYLGDSENVPFDVDKITPTLEVSIADSTYLDDAIIVASLYDGETGLNGVVEVTFGDTTYIVAVADGIGTLPVSGLDVDTYTYTAISRADSTYASATQDAKTFEVTPRKVYIEIDTLGGVDFGEIGAVEVKLHDAETDERIKDYVTLIFTDENGEVLATRNVETIVGPWERADDLEFTAEWPMGDYYVTVVSPNFEFVQDDESEYKFTSFGDEEGTIEYSTGTVKEIEFDEDVEDGFWIKVEVLTNDADESFVGNVYYIDPDVWYDKEKTYQLFIYDNDAHEYVGTGIWVLVSPNGLIPADTTEEYPVHKIGLNIDCVSGDGDYVFGYDHDVVLKLLKFDYESDHDELFELDCSASIVVLMFNEETEEWEEIATIDDLSFEDGIITIDCSKFKPGEYRLKVSISDELYELRVWNDDEECDVDYRIFWDHDPLFHVESDHVYIDNVVGEENTRFGDEHDFSFELWHSNREIEDGELFVYDTNAIVTVYKWNEDEKEYEFVKEIPVEINGGKIETIDFSDLKVGHYQVTVTLDDPDYSFKEWDDEVGHEVNYNYIRFEIYQDNIHADVQGRDWTEYGQERIFKFDLTHWDDELQEDVLFVYDTDAIVKLYKLTWDDDGEHAELIETYDVAITGGHSEELDLSNLNAASYRVTIQLDDEDYELDSWFEDQYGVQEERFDVGRANVNINVIFDQEEYVYGDDVVVTVTVTTPTGEKLNEVVDVDVRGIGSMDLPLEDGTQSFTLENYDVGTYTILVNFHATENYGDSLNYPATFSIGKANPTIDVIPRESEYTYGDDVVLDVTLSYEETGLTGIVEITIGEDTYPVVVIDGSGTLTVSGLNAGTHTYTAKFLEDARFNTVETEEKELFVDKLDVTVDIAVPNFEFGTTGVAFVRVNVAVYDEDGNLITDYENDIFGDEVHLVIDEILAWDINNENFIEIYDVDVNGHATVDLEGSDALPIGICLIGPIINDDNYRFVSNNGGINIFEVIKKQIDIEVKGNEDIEVKDEDTHTIFVGYYDDEGEFTPFDFSGTAIVKVYDAIFDENGWIIPYTDDGEINPVYEGAEVIKTITVAIEEGVGTLSFDELPIGDYVYTISLDDDTYEAFYDFDVMVTPKKGTYTDLLSKINDAIKWAEEEGEEEVALNLEYDFAYDAEFDGENFPDGIVIDKDITIYGNEYSISGSDSNRIFKVVEGAKLSLDDVVLKNGAADKGAGVYVDEGASLYAWAVEFTDNVAVYRGGAIYSEGDVVIKESIIDSNDVTYRDANDDNGGAAVYNLGGSLTIEGTKITNNLKNIVIRDGNEGDLINAAIVTSGDTKITGCELSKNSGSYGGAIYVFNDATLTVEDSVFEENMATFGAAIFADNANVIIDNCDFNSNYCEGTGSPGTSNTQGAAVLVSGATSSASISNSRFNRNRADIGGAVSISASTKECTIDNCEFNQNTANEYGGAVYAWTTGEGTTCITESKFNENSAGYGGAVFAQTDLGLYRSEFNDNEASNYGGAMYIGGTADIDETRFSSNEAQYGGALFLGNADVSIDSSSFEDNEGIGLVYHIYKGPQDSLTIENSYFATVKPSLTIEDDYEYGNDINIAGTFDWGVNRMPITIEYLINGERGTATVTNGEFTIEAGNELNVGTYTVVITSVSDEDGNTYEVMPIVNTFEVSKTSPVITISGGEFDYPADAKAEITVTNEDGDALAGVTLKVTINEVLYAVETNDEGKAIVTVSGLNAGKYDVVAVSVATDNYESASKTAAEAIVINKSDYVGLTVELVNDQIVIGLTGQDNIPLNGVVNVAIDDGEAIPVTVTNGKGTVDASALTAGEHTVTAISEPTDNYNSRTVTETIVVSGAPNEAVITVSVDSITYGDDAVIAVSFTDKEGNPLQGTLAVKINDEDKTVDIGEDGTGTLRVSDLAAGHYNVIVSFAGDNTYQATSKEAEFNVAKAATEIAGQDVTVYATVGKDISFTLKDANGNTLAGKTITVAFDGQTYVKTSDENGVITLENVVMTNKGTYSISASYAGDENHEATFASYNVIVKAKATKLTVSDQTYSVSGTKYVTAKLTAGGEPIANKVVTFSLNGKTYTGRTNADGVVKVAVALTAKKTYSVVVSFAGDTTYGSAVATYKLKVTS